MSFKSYIFILSLLLNACGTTTAEKPNIIDEQVTVEGQAIIKNGAKLLARKMAIRDAIREASLTNNSQINSHTRVDRNTIALDSFSLRTAALVKQTKVIDEWIEKDIYHVRVIINLTSHASCKPIYRKKIVATAFPFSHPSHTSLSESNDLSPGIPREISNMLAESGEYTTRNKTHTVLFQEAGLAPELQENHPYQASEIINLAKNNQAQFVLSGVIRDLDSADRHYTRGNGFGAWLGSFSSYYNNSRAITIDIYIHDGYTGALLFQHRYKDTVDSTFSSIWVPDNVMVGSIDFKNSATGNVITNIINQSANDIQESIGCFPFYTRILKIEGNKIFIDAGAQERINPGDQLIVYRNAGTIHALDSDQEIVGLYKNAVGMMTITEVTPLFSVGELEAPPYMLGVEVGDWVKSW